MNSSTTPPTQGSHLSRVLVIALHAFTQLVRMKVFYFLAMFAVIAIASNFFDLPQHQGPESVGVNVLRSIQSWSLGTMTLFSVVLSIVATALLLPKDVEDRTLYTILAKPVPRLDYLAGKRAPLELQGSPWRATFLMARRLSASLSRFRGGVFADEHELAPRLIRRWQRSRRTCRGSDEYRRAWSDNYAPPPRACVQSGSGSRQR